MIDNRPLRVALFTETFLPKVDGIVTVICLLLDHLAERGVESMLVAPRLSDRLGEHHPTYAATRIVRVPGVTMPLYRELKFGPPHLGTYRQLRAFQPDVAHVFHPLVLGTGGMLMMKTLRVPVLASFHLDMARIATLYGLGFARGFMNLHTRLSFNMANARLAPSRLVQAQLHDLGVREVGLWRRGVDAAKFHPRYRDAAMRDRLTDGHPDDALLLYVGRLSAEKRLGDLRHVLDALPGVRLALVGDGPARAELEAQFAEMPTVFTGYLSGEALSAAYASADVFVFPSELESFGLVVVEAMAAGLPVVASRVGGVMDVVREGETGYTFDAGDVAALVDGVRQTIHDRTRLAQMGAAARAFAETQSWPAMMDEVIDHYLRLATGKASRSRP